jgi:hypothetical protein
VQGQNEQTGKNNHVLEQSHQEAGKANHSPKGSIRIDFESN